MRVVLDGGGTMELGTTETAPTIGITDFSRRVTDDFGVTTVVERGFSRRMAVRLAVPTADVDALQRQLADLRATPATWIADDRFASLSVRGFYKDFVLDLAVPPLSYCTLTIEGLAETASFVDPGTDPAPDGAGSVLRLLQPIDVTPGMIVASNVADAANRAAMFDQALGTATEQAGSIAVTVAPGSTVTAVALLDVAAATVRVQAPGYDRTLAPGAGGTALFLDMPATSGNVTVTATGAGTVAVGTLMLGRLVGLGTTEAAPSAGITDYSRKVVDDFGEVTVVPRAWAKRMTIAALIRSDAVDVVAGRIAAVRARPSLWIGQEGRDSLTVYGFFKDFSIAIGENVSKLALSIEGLSAAAKVQPLVADAIVDWADVRDPLGTKPANNATRVEDTGNMIRPAPNDPATWTYENGAGLFHLSPTGRPLQRNSAALNTPYATVVWGVPVPCVPGEKLWFRQAAAADGFVGDGANARGGLRLFAADRAPLGSIDVPDSAIGGAEARGGIVTRTGTAVVPLGAAYVQPYSIRPPSEGTIAGTIYVAEAWLGRSEPGSDITGNNKSADTAKVGGTDAAVVLQRIADAQGAIDGIGGMVAGIVATAETIDQRVDTMEVVGGAGNLLSNTDFAVIDTNGAAPGWTFLSNNFDVHVPRGRDTLGTAYRPLPEHTLGVFENVYNGNFVFDFVSDWCPIQASLYYQTSAWAALQRCPGKMQLQWGDAAGAVVGAISITFGDGGFGGPALSDFTRRWIKGQAPAGASKARLVITKLGGTSNEGGNNNSWLWFLRPMLAEATADLSAPSAYRPGGGLATSDHLRAKITETATVAANATGAVAERTATLEATSGSQGARLTTTEQVAASAFDRVTGARWSKEAVAGNGRAQLTVYAFDDGTPGSGLRAGVDIIGDLSIRGDLFVDGTVYTSKIAPGAVSATGVAVGGGGLSSGPYDIGFDFAVSSPSSYLEITAAGDVQIAPHPSGTVASVSVYINNSPIKDVTPVARSVGAVTDASGAPASFCMVKAVSGYSGVIRVSARIQSNRAHQPGQDPNIGSINLIVKELKR